MAAFQLGYIESVWDPLYDPGTQAILTSRVSEAFPVSRTPASARSLTRSRH